jgi:hypothetical protein
VLWCRHSVATPPQAPYTPTGNNGRGFNLVLCHESAAVDDSCWIWNAHTSFPTTETARVHLCMCHDAYSSATTNTARSNQNLLNPAAQPAGTSFKTNVNRSKTRKWAEAKNYSYDGDDWGGYDPYDEYGSYDDKQDAPLPAAAPRRNSFETGEEVRSFSSGQQQPPPPSSRSLFSLPFNHRPTMASAATFPRLLMSHHLSRRILPLRSFANAFLLGKVVCRPACHLRLPKPRSNPHFQSLSRQF